MYIFRLFLSTTSVFLSTTSVFLSTTSVFFQLSSVFESITFYSIKPLKGTSWHFSTASANSQQLHQVNALLVLQANRHLTHREEHSRLLPTHLNFHQRRISGPYSDIHLVLRAGERPSAPRNTCTPLARSISKTKSKSSSE